MTTCAQGLVALLHAALEKGPASSAKNVASDVSALRVPAENELCLGALFVVGPHLVDAVARALGHRVAVGRLERVVVLDVFIVAAVDAGADGCDELALPSWVGFVVAAREKDVHVFTGGRGGDGDE